MCAKSSCRTFHCLYFALLLQSAAANAFLRGKPKTSTELMSEIDVQMSLLAEIEDSLGSGAKRIHELEALLKPMFNALPKNQHGGLEHSTARYALHRIFLHRHGWSIEGLDRAGQSWNSTSPTGMLKDRVPAYVQDVFEKRLAGKGLGLYELAVLASTIEHLIHSEALSQLGAIFSLHQISPTSLLNDAEVNEILESFMIMHVFAGRLGSVKNMTLDQLKAVKKQYGSKNTIWKDTRSFIRREQTNLAGTGENLDFAGVLRFAEHMSEQFGSIQNRDCQDLKAHLLTLEYHGTGRVRLPDFYHGNPGSGWIFDETTSYLRDIGALDESSPDDPKVIIPNYVGAASNCITSLSSYYSVCCKDECESLLTKLEDDIKSPVAGADRIAELVARLPASSRTAPRQLSPQLRQRLEEIATAHGGSVPLHGRLFSQWMHHAYPRECPYPHISGTTVNMRTEDWDQQNGQSNRASKDEIMRIIGESRSAKPAAADAVHEGGDLEMLPWLHEEELLVNRAPHSRSLSTVLRKVVAFVAVGSLSVAAVQNWQTIASQFQPASKSGLNAAHKYYV
jgi:hypothetical protein